MKAVFGMTLLLCCWFGQAALAADPELVLGDVTLEQGSSAALPISLAEGSEPYAGFNARIALPAGISVTGVTRGPLMPEADFLVEWAPYSGADGTGVAIVAYSGTTAVTAASGVLVELQLAADDTAPAGTHAAAFASVNPESDINSRHALSNGSGTVSVVHATVDGMVTITAAVPPGVPVTGQIVDASGAPVSGATITILETGQSTVTGVNGDFVLVEVAEGAYAIRVEIPGMGFVEVTDVVVVAGQPLMLPPILYQPCPEPAWSPVIYTNSTTVYCTVTIEGQPAQIGDKVAAFVGSECRAVQDVVVSGGVAYVTLVVQGIVPEQATFKVFDMSQCAVFDVHSTVLMTDPGMSIGLPDFFELNYIESVDQVLSLAQGWNLLTISVVPDDASPAAVFQSVIGDLLEIKDTTSSYSPQVPAPLNTLQLLEPGSGYWVRVASNTTLTTTGVPGDCSLAIPLNAGWNLIGMPCLGQLTVGDAFAGVLGDLLEVKDTTNSFNPALPPFLNTLEIVESGTGYWVNMSAPASLIFPEPAPAASPATAPEGYAGGAAGGVSCVDIWNPVVYTNSTTAYGIVTINGAPAEPGDIVAAFVDGECRAAQPVALFQGSAYASLVIGGLVPESVTFQVYDSSEQRIFEVPSSFTTDPGNSIGFPPAYLDLAATLPSGYPSMPTAATVDVTHVCGDVATDIILTAVGGSGESVEWLTGSCDGSVLGTGSPLTIAAPPTTTEYYVRWRVGDCIVTHCASVTVTVESVPLATAANSGPVCDGGVVQLDAPSGMGSYMWSGPGGFSSTLQSPVVDPAVPGTYELVVTQNGCASVPATTEVVVHSGPSTPNGLTASPATICVGAAVTLSASSDVEWFSGDCLATSIGIGSSINVTPTVTTTYFAQAIDSSTGCTSTECATITVQVLAPPQPPQSVTALPSSLCAGETSSVELIATGGAGDELVWFAGTCDGTVVGFGPSLTVPAPATTTEYFARWESASCGASACASVVVTVEARPTMPTGLAATPQPTCPGDAVTLTAAAPVGSDVEWYDLCDGTLLGSGASIVVTPTAPTTYFARSIDLTTGCRSSACASVDVAFVDPPQITTELLPPAQVGVAYDVCLQGVGAVAPISWALGANALCVTDRGLSLVGDCLVGTPTQHGVCTFTVLASDACSTPQSATRELTLEIAPAPQASIVVLDDVPALDAAVGDDVQLQLHAHHAQVVTGGANFANFGFTPELSQLVLAFRASIEHEQGDAVVAIGDLPGSQLDDFALAVRFTYDASSMQQRIEVRDGGAFGFTGTLYEFEVDTTYEFSVQADLQAQRYSVWVKQVGAGHPTVLLADQFDFFVGSGGTVGSLGYLAMNSASGDLRVAAATVGSPTAVAISGFEAQPMSYSFAATPLLDGNPSLDASGMFEWNVPSAASGQIYDVTFVAAGSSNSDSQQTTIQIAIAPPQPAGCFSIADGSTGVPINAILSWCDQGGATSFGVHFGTSATPSLQATTSDTQWTPPSLLEYATTYYWQIDATNGAGTAPGSVLSFTTMTAPIQPPAPAHAPLPMDGATDVPVTVVLEWLDDGTADLFQLSLGTNPALNAGDVVATQAESEWDPPRSLEYSTTYYWIVVSMNQGGMVGGPTWSFTTEPEPITVPLPATSPLPLDGATGVPITTDLSWINGGGATSFDVYVGTTANLGTAEFQGNQATTLWTSATLLEYDTTYYWSIDALNDGGVATGATWSFTTEACPDPAPFISTVALSNATVGVAYSDTLTAVDGHGALTWSVLSGEACLGSLGLTVSPSGEISGAPVTAGVCALSVQVSDECGQDHVAHLVFQVDAPPSLVIDRVASLLVGAGQTLNVPIVATHSQINDATTGFRNYPFSAAGDSFTFHFRASVEGAAVDAVVALSNVAADHWDDYAILIRFSSNNASQTPMIDVRDGAGYSYTSAQPYTFSPETTYDFTVDVSLLQESYTVWVTRAGSSEPPTLLASDFAFRDSYTALNEPLQFLGTRALSGELRVAEPSVDDVEIEGFEGHPVTYSHTMTPLATGAATDVQSGFFVWEVPPAAMGVTHTVTFTANDGMASASCDATFDVATTPAFARGDVNGDGRWDLVDVARVLSFVFGNPYLPLPCLDAADANADGSVNVADVVYLLVYQFSGGPPPAQPFPEVGLDDTPLAPGCDETP